jgi:para-nitrobenzyl esterase
MFADEPSGPASVEQYRAWLKKEFGAEWQAVEKGYAARNDSEVKTAFLAVVTDHEFGSSTYIMARAMKRIGQRVYFYYFTYPAKGKNARLGAYHGLELSFLAGMARKSSWGEFGPADEALSQTMRAYWTEFANTSDPNKSGLPQWPEYEGTKETCLEIGRHVRLLPVPHRERYRVFQEILKTKLAALAARDN